MTEYKVSYAPPTGKPLGTNFAFKIGTKVVIPLLNLVGKKVWRGGEKLPKSGKIIVASNHVSYLDVLFLTHFLFRKMFCFLPISYSEMAELPDTSVKRVFLRSPLSEKLFWPQAWFPLLEKVRMHQRL